MKSRITIEIDYDAGNKPVIQITQRDSDDVRDGLLKAFLQTLSHVSSYARITYENEYEDHQGRCKIWKIWPVSKAELPEHAKLLNALVTTIEQ